MQSQETNTLLDFFSITMFLFSEQTRQEKKKKKKGISGRLLRRASFVICHYFNSCLCFYALEQAEDKVQD